MHPKSIGIGFLFIVSSSALLQQSQPYPNLEVVGVGIGKREAQAAQGTCCCRLTGKPAGACGDWGRSANKGHEYFRIEGGAGYDKKNKFAICCLVKQRCDKFTGYHHPVENYRNHIHLLPGHTVNSATCEEIDETGKIKPRLKREWAFKCPMTMPENACPPEKANCESPPSNIFCRGVSRTLCLINDFTKEFGLYMDVTNSAGVSKGSAGAVKFIATENELMDASLLGALKENVGEFAATVGPVGLAGAFSGLLMNVLKLLNLVCKGEGSVCDRGKHAASIAIAITSICLALTGVGIPLVGLTGGLLGLMVRKFGAEFCKNGLINTVRSWFAEGSWLFKEMAKLYPTSLTQLIAAPYQMGKSVLKLISMLIQHLLMALLNTIFQIPRAVSAAIKAVRTVMNRNREDNIKARYTASYCCALDSVETDIGAELDLDAERLEGELKEVESD